MNTVTLIGNLTDDPVLRYTGDGKAVAHLTVAVSRRVRGEDGFVDRLDGYFKVVAFGDLADHILETHRKGARVLVTGRLSQDSYDDDQGVRRSAVRIMAEDVAPSLRFATAAVTKATANATG